MSARQILVIGRSGQLAQALAATGRAGLVVCGRPEADLADPRSLAAAFEAVRPDVVINAAAYTAVDGAETDGDTARLINAVGPQTLADLCAAAGIPLIHVSTDCVFDGTHDAPYTEDNPVSPISIYGQTKANGERAVASGVAQHLVVRVSWVFSEFASNFVRTILALAARQEEVTVVSDQIGYPTYCPDIARGLLVMADRAATPGFDGWGIYHLAGDAEIDRAAMAQRIFEVSARHGGPVARVVPVKTADYRAPARRPLNARLNSEKAEATFGLRLTDWTGGLERSVAALVARQVAK